MEITDKLIKSLCSSTIYKRGLEYFRQGRVHIKVREQNLLTSVVDGEEVYNVRVKCEDNNISGYFCSCPYYETMNTPCKHIVATLLQRKNELSTEGTDNIYDTNDRLAHRLCHAYSGFGNDKKRLHVHFEISLQNRGFHSWNYDVRFSVEGKSISAPKNFLKNIFKGESYLITKKLLYSPDEYFFGTEETQIFKILSEASENNMLVQTFYSSYDEHTIQIGETSLKRIFRLLSNVDYSIVLNRMNVDRMPIEFDNPDILIDISATDGEISLYSGNYGTALVSDGELFIFEDTIYIPTTQWCKSFMPVYNSLAEDFRTQISFKGENAMSFATFALPVLSKMHGVVTHNIENTVINEHPEFSVYLDARARGIMCTVKVSYGNISLLLPEAVNPDKKIIIRNIEAENEVLDILSGFEYKNGYYILEDDELIFEFFKHKLKLLEKMASVYTTDKFLKFNIKQNINITGNITYNEKENFLEATLKSDLSYDEIREILAAVKLKKPFYRLADGSFADIEQDFAKLERFSRLGFSAENFLNEKKILPRYQMLYLNALSVADENSGFEVSDEICRYVEEIKNVKPKIPSHLNNVLRDYQKKGITWLKQISMLGLGGILADDMGLGKTLQIIAFLYGEKPNKPVLIVTPSSLTYNWKNEISKFIPEAKALIVDGNSTEREQKISEVCNVDFLITSYPLLRRDISKYENIEFSYCIIDEAQSIKNPKTVNAISVKRINAERRFALTGTPIENSLSELWSVFDFLIPGYLNKYSEFKEWYEAPIEKNGDEYALSELKNKISPFILRRMKKDVLSELPDKIESVIFADMSEKQKKVYAAYQEIAKDRALSILNEGEAKIEILTLLLRLRQISCHPSLFDINYKGDSGKLNALEDLVLTAVSSEHRVLVFSQFTSMLDIIKVKLKSKGIDCFYLDGSTPAHLRAEYADRFNGGERSVFLVSLKAGGFGLNLTGADMVIHYDPWWNPAVTEQASDRAYRMGQTKNVQVIRLASKNTIEEKILKLQESKKKLAENVISGGAYSIGNMSSEEILALFD